MQPQFLCCFAGERSDTLDSECSYSFCVVLQVKDLTPQIVNAARVLFTNPNNQAAIEHFELLKKQWTDNMERLRGLVDEAVDTAAFIRAEGTPV